MAPDNDKLMNVAVALNEEQAVADAEAQRLAQELVRMIGLELEQVDTDELMTTSMRLVRALDVRNAKRKAYTRVKKALAGLMG